MQTDVVIVGAGPAGATLAYLLSKSKVKVTLIESEKNLDRQFRGPAYQPACIRMWEEMGILPHIKKLHHHKIDNFSLFDKEKRLLKINIAALPTPYNAVYLMEQGPLLNLMVKLSAQYENFTYIGNALVTALSKKEDAIQGVTFSLNGEEHFISSRLVVAADGRFSRLRSLASIDLESEKQNLDILWFDVPTKDNSSLDAGVHLIKDGAMILLPKENGHIQIGWILPKGSYELLKAEGIDHIKKETLLAVPTLKEAIENHLTGFEQCHLLDIKIAKATKWCQNGLLLIGDAAHIASPVGAQGNKLAIEDACLAHAIITKALKNEVGLLLSEVLEEFQAKRKKDVATTLNLQKRGAKALLEIKSPFAKSLRNLLLPIIPYTPIGRRARKIMALSPHPIPVQKKLFSSEEGKGYPCYVTNIKRLSRDTITISFTTPKHFNYRSGQFIILRFLLDGALYKRAYSLTSAPQIDDICSFTVKKAKQGLISSALHDTLKEGDLLIVEKPSGNFTLPKGAAALHYSFIAAGSGITPCFSLIKTLLKYAKEAHLSLFYINHDESSIIFKEELEALQSAHKDRFTIEHYLTKEKGRPSNQTFEDFIRDSRANAHNPIYYLCGPQPLLQIVEHTLEAHHVPISRVYIERFSSLSEAYEMLFRQKEPISSQIEVGISNNKERPQIAEVTLSNKSYQIPCSENGSLLDAALDAGLKAPYSCKEGICRSCRAKLKKGKVICHKAGALSSAELKEGYILTCGATPVCNNICIDFE